MKERCHISLPWFSMGQIAGTGSSFIISGLIVRWNEAVEAIDGPDGQQTSYSYDAIRFDLELPAEVQPGQEAVEYYLEQAKDTILAQAQALLAQEVGFCAQ